MKKIFISLAVIIACLAAGSCGNKKNPMEENLTTVLIETSKGNIKVALYDETPLHRDNFIKLCSNGTYDGVLFHRVIGDFMIQTGDPDSKNAKPHELLGGEDPDCPTIPAEFRFPQYFHKRGALAAARQADSVNAKKESSGTQWYIVTGKKYKAEQLREYEINMDLDKKMKLIEKGKKERMKEIFQLRKEGKKEEVQNIYEQIEDNAQMEVAKHPFIRFPQNIIDTYVNVGGCPFLDSQYTVFGEVLEGMDVVDAIQYVKTDPAKRPLEDIKIIKVTVNKPSNK